MIYDTNNIDMIQSARSIFFNINHYFVYRFWKHKVLSSEHIYFLTRSWWGHVTILFIACREIIQRNQSEDLLNLPFQSPTRNEKGECLFLPQKPSVWDSEAHLWKGWVISWTSQWWMWHLLDRQNGTHGACFQLWLAIKNWSSFSERTFKSELKCTLE